MTDAGRADARAHDGALPDLPEHHRRRRSRDPADRASGSRSRSTRCRAARRSSTGPCPTSGTFDDAYIAVPDGERVVDFRESNLHVVSYSEPVRASMTLDELRPHLHTHAERRDWIPYRTSYYTRDWGFCLTQSELDALDDGEYEVVIDSTLEPGALTYGECVIPGERDDEILLTTHVCHPSLANDNLSGIALLTELAATLAEQPRRLHLPVPLHPRHDRLDHLARAQRGELDADRRRARCRLRRRCCAPLVQAQPPRRRAASIALPSTCSSRHDGARVTRLRALGLGRAPVQLPGLRPARRLPHPVARGRVRGVPLVRG